MSRTVYEAANAVEAQMLQDLLKQDGIATRIDGAFLQGAVGELQAGGLVRLVVEDDDDHARARAVIEQWERAEPDAPSASSTPSAPRRGGRALWALLGAAVGIAGTAALMRAPVSVDGIDYNGDGVLDEQWSYSKTGTVVEARLDRNLDGKVDLVQHSDWRGRIETTESDDDFDGRFETLTRFRLGNAESSEIDTDGDGIPDLRSWFKHGVLETNEYLDPVSGKPRRVERLKLGRVVATEIDTDRDGRLDTRLDTRLEHAVDGSVAKTAPIAAGS